MKLSVSVPDELWHDVRSLAQSPAPSAVVQEAMRRWIAQAPEHSRVAADPPADALSAMQAACDRLAHEARAEYQHGYKQGVQCAQRLPWWAVESLADNYQFNVARWARGWAAAAVELDRPLSKEEGAKVITVHVGRPRPYKRPFDWAPVDESMRAPAGSADSEWSGPHVVVRALVPALGMLVPPYGDAVSFEPTTTYLRGFTQAMRDVWSSVTEGIPGGAR